MTDRMSKSSEDPPQEGARWLTTFNDLMTLLMVFFVLLFTMGSIDAMKLKNFSNSLQGGLGIMFEGQHLSIGVVNPIVRLTKEDRVGDHEHEKRLDNVEDGKGRGKGAQDEGAGQGTGGNQNRSGNAASLKQVAEALATVNGARVTLSSGRAVLTLGDCILFNVGEAEINPAGFPALDRIGAILARVPNRVRIEGHTDDLPIHSTRFPSNWELSTARAVNVLRYLVEVGHIAPQRLSAAGYGKSKPILPNDTPGNRARNRRVEILVLKEKG